jgi:hypothetical protein
VCTAATASDGQELPVGISRPRRLIRPSAKEESEARRRSWRWSLPISSEHAAIKERIERPWAEFISPLDPDSPDFDERLDELIVEDPNLANMGARVLAVAYEEEEYLFSQGVPSRPWCR